MNKRIPITFLFILLPCYYTMASSFKYQMTSTEYEFLPKTPRIISSDNKQTLTTWCEMHVDALADNTLFIKQLRGQGEVNGTTLNTGYSMSYTVRPYETIQIIISQNGQIQFTNIGSSRISAICY